MRLCVPMGCLALSVVSCGSAPRMGGPEAANHDAQTDDAQVDNAQTDDAPIEAESDEPTSGNTASDAEVADAASAMSFADAGVAASSSTYTMLVTFYGWADNCPPGDAIGYAKSDGFPTVHDVAGGTGTYADPLTMATDMAELAIGTKVYLPFCSKYAVMEDDCAECDTDWSTTMKRHIDVWMTSDGVETASALTICEDQWTEDATSVEVDPPPGRPVSAAPLFSPTTNTCEAVP